MNRNQPRLMQNYTSAGYAKEKAPRALFEQLKAFFEEHRQQQQLERWSEGSTFVNHWEAPTYMVELKGGNAMKQKIISHVQPILEAWSGQPLVPTSLYGIRIYQGDAMLAPHVDRLPLVTSAIINVAQDVDEPWPLELIGHDGWAVNVTIEPGEMILYESHSVLHGRPFPLQGRYYANVFVHFEPHGHTERHNKKQERHGFSSSDRVKGLYEKAKDYSPPKPGRYSDIPHYIQEGSDEETWWRQQYVFHQEKKKGKTKKTTVVSGQQQAMTVHTAAALGRLEVLKIMEKNDPDVLTKGDDNGWRPIHEAARGGHEDVINYLVRKGADVNERTNNGRGGTPLWWAEQMLDEDHPAIQILRGAGAQNIAPEVVE